MKSSLVIKLVQAHSSRNEDEFKKALTDLANDEERKGNIALSSSLLSAYTSDSSVPLPSFLSPLSGTTFSTQNAIPSPRDRDSTLELLEILEPKIRLKDVALPEEVEEALQLVINEQLLSNNLISNGISPTNRVLFVGPPGCGKTMTANALAGEIGIPIAYVRLDGLVSSYLGQTGTNIRKIFDYVKNKRIMLFLDEFDAIAKKRDDSHELGELKRVVTTLLQNMDNMPANVFLVAATNHHHLLDPAIWRRFNTTVFLGLPDELQRKNIISIKIDELMPKYSVDVPTILKLTDGMSGADIVNFLEIIAKYCVINGIDKGLADTDLVKIWINQSTLFLNNKSEAYIKVLSELKNKGFTIRYLEKITGIPKSTLSYKFNKEENNERG